ncbi:unnamed protein product [Amoebophrya sp. A120]|nr:unnamed protein product [Amoebophrya sp. A120]|eukprot:GSA120T00025691001.1
MLLRGCKTAPQFASWPVPYGPRDCRTSQRISRVGALSFGCAGGVVRPTWSWSENLAYNARVAGIRHFRIMPGLLPMAGVSALRRKSEAWTSERTRNNDFVVKRRFCSASSTTVGPGASTVSSASSASGGMATDLSRLRNVAIIAHVDHGKTTLVDEILSQSGMAGDWRRGARHLDSNALEQERGITILSKVTRINAPNRGGYTFNIVDTPGHADFGGEVERVLSMVEGVVLLVDAAEGPKTQTRFVLQKALQMRQSVSGAAGGPDAAEKTRVIKPLVVINKVDKPTRRAYGEVENDIFDLFVSLDATEEQLDYPTLYASGKEGWCVASYDEAMQIVDAGAGRSGAGAVPSEKRNLDALFAAIEQHVPQPPHPSVHPGPHTAVDSTGSSTAGGNSTSSASKPPPFAMLVSQLDQLPQLGMTVTGKISSGTVQKGDKMDAKNGRNELVGQGGKVKEITVVRGTKREKLDRASQGDIVSLSFAGGSSFAPASGSATTTSEAGGAGDSTAAGAGGPSSSGAFQPRWTQTVFHSGRSKEVEPIPCTEIDPPVICVKVTVNDAPGAGKAKFIALYDIYARLRKEALVNVAIGVEENADKSALRLSGRGELQLGILIENMRREGYEMTLSPPRVVTTIDPSDGVTELEPWESVQVDVPTDLSATVIERLSSRGGELKEMDANSKNRTTLRFEIASRNFFGLRAWVTEATGGQAAVACEMIPPRPLPPAAELEAESSRPPVFVSANSGVVYLGDHRKASMKGKLFVNAGDHVYEGQIVGEISSNTGSQALHVDAEINLCHKHDGYASCHGASGIGTQLSLEEMLVYLQEDECLEVRPDRLAMRKLLLSAVQRKTRLKQKLKQAQN